MEILDLLIVGAGPAGITAAIYAKRANINSIITQALGLMFITPLCTRVSL